MFFYRCILSINICWYKKRRNRYWIDFENLRCTLKIKVWFLIAYSIEYIWFPNWLLKGFIVFWTLVNVNKYYIKNIALDAFLSFIIWCLYALICALFLMVILSFGCKKHYGRKMIRNSVMVTTVIFFDGILSNLFQQWFIEAQQNVGKIMLFLFC